MPFSELGLSPEIVRAVREAGYTEPTPIQTRAIPPIIEGRDLIGIAQTGTGKTAAFVLPLLELLRRAQPPAQGPARPRVLVLTPTRELAAQVEENLRAYARHLPLRSAIIFGGVSEGPQISALRAGADIVVATPGRLLDHMGKGVVKFTHLQALVLDEGDRMLDMGFLPDIRRVIRQIPAQRQTLLFSATFPSDIEKVSREFQKNPITVEVARRATPVESVSQFVYEVPKALKISLLLHLLKDEALNTVLVFSRTKHGADKIARRLAEGGVKTATLHSNRSQNQRIQALNGFKKGEYRVLVATDIAARGIDVDGISHVINYDFPMHAEDYVHRIGRTGRAHAVGDALSFVTAEDRGPLNTLERFLGRGIPRKKAEDFDYAAPATDVSYDHREHRGRGRDAGRDGGRGGERGRESAPREWNREGLRGRYSGEAPRGDKPAHDGMGNAQHWRPGMKDSGTTGEKPAPRSFDRAPGERDRPVPRAYDRGPDDRPRRDDRTDDRRPPFRSGPRPPQRRDDRAPSRANTGYAPARREDIPPSRRESTPTRPSSDRPSRPSGGFRPGGRPTGPRKPRGRG